MAGNSADDSSSAGLDSPIWPEHQKKTKHKLKRDWSMDLGGSAKVGAATFPAKYTFSTTSKGNCSSASSPDYVVYNTSVAGSNTGTKQANIIAYDNIYSGCSSHGTVPGLLVVLHWNGFRAHQRRALRGQDESGVH